MNVSFMTIVQYENNDESHTYERYVVVVDL